MSEKIDKKIFYSDDWNIEEIEQVNPKWHKLGNQLDLNIYFSTEEFKKRVEEILKKMNYEINEENFKKTYKAIIIYTKLIMADISNKLSKAFYEHFNENYPILPIRKEDYQNPEIRNIWLKTIKKLREDLFKVEEIDGSKILPPNLIDEFHKNNFEKIKETIESQDETPYFLKDPVPPIVLIGVDYSAESLRKNLNEESFPDEKMLENQEGNAYADYFLDVVAFTTEFSAWLLDFGLKKKEKLSLRDNKFFKKIFDELTHRLSDLYLSIGEEELEEIKQQTDLSEEEILFWRTPRYGIIQVKNEQIFFEEIGGKQYGYQGEISKFIRERGPLYAGKLEELIKFFIESKPLNEQNLINTIGLALDASVKR
ncbi:MAG: hypothetical protein QXU74_02410 [Candidatus Aenigmatarchaeota archaeon]